VIALIVIIQSCHSSENQQAISSEWRNVYDTNVHYVGMQSCKSCHADKYETFSHTGMGKSFGDATPQKSLANFHNNKPVYDATLDYYYFPYFVGDKLYIKEYRLSGKDTTHVYIQDISYIIGSGHHTNSHLLSENGYLYQSPLTYYIQKGQWDLPPGFENGYNSRFRRILDFECISCHNAYPDLVKGSVNKYTSMPTGIDCERCHGPGSLHIAEKQSGLVVDTKLGVDYSIVNPKKLPYDLQIDVCQRCHLQGDAVLKEGKNFYSFRPGMHLNNVMSIFLPVYENQEKGFLMASHAERLHKSNCFLKTMEGDKPSLTCISCHNPHVSVQSLKADYFIEKCQTCHINTHKPAELSTWKIKGDNCITCHMPKTGSIDIPHVRITDHYIRKNNKKGVSSAEGMGKFKSLTSVNNPNPDDRDKTLAFIYYYEKFSSNKALLDSAYLYLQKFKPSEKPDLYILYYYSRGEWAKVTTADLIKKPLRTALLNYRVGQSYYNQNNYAKAEQFFVLATDIEPYNLDYQLKLAQTYINLKSMAQAQGKYQFILKENSKIYEAYNGLALIALSQNNLVLAYQNLSKCLKLNPDYEPALINMAKYELGNGYTDKAKVRVTKILKKNPTSVQALQLQQYLNQLN